MWKGCAVGEREVDEVRDEVGGVVASAVRSWRFTIASCTTTVNDTEIHE